MSALVQSNASGNINGARLNYHTRNDDSVKSREKVSSKLCSLDAVIDKKGVRKPVIQSPWNRTITDLSKVISLRKELKYGGYPFGRLIQNQIGDGILAGAVAGIAVISAGVSPLLAGLLVWATRSVEFSLAVVWNQHMSSQRREARLAATEGDTLKGLKSKVESAREMVSSGYYDVLTGLAAVGAIATAVAGGPIGVVIGFGVCVAAFQTMSKFKEVAWASLRYVVNSDTKLQKRMVDLQEPMSAFEMAINIGVMTISYLVSFSALAAFYVFLPHVAIPVSLGLAVVGSALMVSAKIKFKRELVQASEELNLHSSNRIRQLTADIV